MAWSAGGPGQPLDGKAAVTLPEHFGLVTMADGLTVQLTPRAQWLELCVAELGTGQLVVREAQDKSGLSGYRICGVRKSYEQHEVIRPR